MPAREPPARESSAFAPGHVTGVFAPELTERDPRARGSVGAGIVLELGVTATARWWPERRASRRIVSDVPGPLPISAEVLGRLTIAQPGRFEVRLNHALPVGQGFGMSAAGALATGLAVAGLVRAPDRRAVEVAHLADLFGGGGLGGVAAILGGGLEVRRQAGIPPFGRVVHRPYRRPLILAVLGQPIPSPRLLRDPRFLTRVRELARPALRRLGGRAAPELYWEQSEAFSDALGLTSPRGRRLLASLRSAGAHATQSMFGHSVVVDSPSPRVRRATLRTIERSGLRAVEIGASLTGARRLTPS